MQCSTWWISHSTVDLKHQGALNKPWVLTNTEVHVQLSSPEVATLYCTHVYVATPHLPRTSLHRLPGEDLDRSPGSRVDLVIHHVLQSLIVGGAKEDLCVQLATSKAIVEHFIATEMVAILVQQFRDLLHINSIIKGCSITNLTLVSWDLQEIVTNNLHEHV